MIETADFTANSYVSHVRNRANPITVTARCKACGVTFCQSATIAGNRAHIVKVATIAYVRHMDPTNSYGCHTEVPIVSGN